MSIGRRLGYTFLGMIAPFVVIVLAYVGYVWIGTAIGVAHTSGTLAGLAVRAPVRIVRDARGVPHIRAASANDAAFAQGFVTGSDRLFQIDVTRRYVLGTLSEMLGSTTMDADQAARIVDLRGIVDAEYAHLPAADRALLQAYADGVNAAAKAEPAPPEYRALLYRFEPWRPQDSLAVGFAVVLDLTDSWYDVIMRDAVEREVGPRATAAFFSLTDPKYDVPTVGGRPVTLPPLPALDGARPLAPVAWNGDNLRDSLGSNEWVAGVGRTATGRALLANDPHLARRIPGIWHLVDVAFPGEHVAGVAIAGVPGVILGHNERVAWGVTSAYAVSPLVYAETFQAAQSGRYRAGAAWVAAGVRHETFKDRFGAPRFKDYLTTRHGFVLEAAGTLRHAVQWEPLTGADSPVEAFLGLDRAASIEDGLRALRGFPGPALNFALAQSDGRAGFALAGFVPNDPSWGLRVLDGPSSPAQPLAFVPFARLPHLDPARDVLAINANNLPYGAGYPDRLSAYYPPPYRAAEITGRLRAHPRVDVADSQALQADTLSLGERELARLCVAALRSRNADRDPDVAPAYAALVAFDGRFDSTSRGATVVQRIRAIATRDLIVSHLSAPTAAMYLRNGPGFVTLDARAARTPARLVSARRSQRVPGDRSPDDHPPVRWKGRGHDALRQRLRGRSAAPVRRVPLRPLGLAVVPG